MLLLLKFLCAIDAVVTQVEAPNGGGTVWPLVKQHLIQHGPPRRYRQHKQPCNRDDTPYS